MDKFGPHNIYDKKRQILHYFFLFYVFHKANGVLWCKMTYCGVQNIPLNTPNLGTNSLKVPKCRIIFFSGKYCQKDGTQIFGTSKNNRNSLILKELRFCYLSLIFFSIVIQDEVNILCILPQRFL